MNRGIKSASLRIVWVGLMISGLVSTGHAGTAKIQLGIKSLSCKKVSTEKEEGDTDEVYCIVVGLNSDSTAYKNVLPGAAKVWTLKQGGTQAVANLLDPTGKGDTQIKLFEDESVEVFVLFFESDGKKEFGATRDTLLKGLRFGLNDEGKTAGGMVERALKAAIEGGDEFLGGISFKATNEEKLVKSWRPLSILSYHDMTPAQLKKVSNKPEFKELVQSVKVLDVTKAKKGAKGTFEMSGSGSLYEITLE